MGLFRHTCAMCSRVTYLGPESTVVTGRTLDWMVPSDLNLWILPARMVRDGAATLNPLEWTSKFGSIVGEAFGGATADGLNEKGLCVNLLYLEGTDYGVRDPSRPGLCVSAWAQYLLDLFDTVVEAVVHMSTATFQLVAPRLPGGYPPVGHISISDSSGDCAVIECLAGKFVIHHGTQYQVMTNEPAFDEQLALVKYWKEIGGMLPGTERPSDRFIRASYYLDRLESTADSDTAIANVMSLIRNVSVPFLAESNPDSPNISPTLLRVIADQKNLRYFFEDTQSPNTYWVELKNFDLSEHGAVLHLHAEGGPIRAGEVSGEFIDHPMFDFLPEYLTGG